jgi:hypothetical protein
MSDALEGADGVPYIAQCLGEMRLVKGPDVSRVRRRTHRVGTRPETVELPK